MSQRNLGDGMQERVPLPAFTSADQVVQAATGARRPGTVDILLVNPPAPDRGIWIRSQHRVGRRSREGMIWPQVSLAQMAALFPDYRVEVLDAIPYRMAWSEFEQLLEAKRPRYYITQVTGPTLRNDLYGVFLAKSVGATTIAFGTHVTPLPEVTMQSFPSLDFVLRGEPELTLRELIDTLEASRSPGREPHSGLDASFRERLHKLFTDADPDWRPVAQEGLSQIRGLVWRSGGQIVVNPDRPFIRHLDDLPLPRHDLLPLEKYKAPLVKGPYAFVVTSRGCPAGCVFCIKHVSYGRSVRLRSPENIMAELELLAGLGVSRVHMYADLFTLSREQVMGLCKLIQQRGLKIRWTCNSRVDFVDPEMLTEMGRAGCWMISWGIEFWQRRGVAPCPQGDYARSGGAGPPVGQGGRHPQLGLFYHRAARRDGGNDPGNDSSLQKAAAGPGSFSHRGAVPRLAAVL